MPANESIQAVALVGAGTMSTDVAAIFVARGIEVHVVSRPGRNLDTVRERIGKSCDQIAGAKGPRGAIHTASDMATLPWQRIGLAIESVTEDLALKQGVFADLERHASSRIPLTSNSSSFPISRIGEGLKTQARMFGLHFFMPAHLVPLVEVVCSDKTDVALAERVGAFMESLDCMAVMVRRDIPGFLANRLQHALMREAWSLIDRGIATPADVDKAVRFGFGMRYLAAGPVLQKEHSGLDVNFLASSSVFPDLCNDDRPPPALADKVKRGEIGMKSGQGFWPWPPERIAREKARYARMLGKALAALREDDK
ncbi:MAG TPA: 3-hydroxyacyl-CoA dehydrogenase NAD-binding domain-containing protein [Burkholderiales bacterium]|jgi:3-hydroxybutyryl-CoA dehydrogenase|nr:3-hydroxyacyl-CoA dehydrogenase NAD-binding domain-containing protein [Burkholderiales bacterium]